MIGTNGERMGERIPRAIGRVCVALALGSLVLATRAVAQDDGPTLSPAVERALSASYLTEDERSALRVFHGQWTADDLADPALAARAALLAGDYLHPALDSEHADALDRAEARIARGDVREGLAIAQEHDSMRALRLAAWAHEQLGELDAVGRVTARAVERLSTDTIDDAGELTEGVRLLRIRARAVDVSEGAGEYELMADLLARVRERLDRLYWPARLAEARLLASRDNRAEGGQALEEALAMNPRSAAAWATLGRAQVRTFGFDAAEGVADRLEAIARSVRAEAVSAEAALLRGRLLLRQRQPARAAAVLDDLLESYPTMRRALALRAAVAAVYEDRETEARLLGKLDRLSPGTAAGHFEAGSQLSDWRQYKPARAHLREAAGRQPAWPEAWIELGLLSMQAADDAEAIAALERAVALDPFNRRAANSLRLAREMGSYERIETEHFLIRYRPGQDELLAREMGPVLERIHERVTGRAGDGLAHEPPGRTVIDLMPNHEWFAVRITGMPDLFTIAASTGPAIALESPRPGPNSTQDGYDWARVLRHEYVHTVSLSRTRNRIPHWFTEAAAVHLEDGPWDGQRARLLADALRAGELYDLDDLSLGFIRPERPNGRALAYAQAAWVYEFIIDRHGSDAPLALMDAYAEGLTQAQAFERVLGAGVGEVQRAFLAWAADRARGWGLLEPEGVPPAGALLERYREEDAGAQAAGTEAALEDVRALLEQHPGHAGLIELRARLLLEANGGRPAEPMADALRAWASAQPVADEPRRLLVLLARGRGALDPGDEEVVRALEHLDARESYSGAYAAELARLYTRRGDFDRALTKAQRAVGIEPFDAPTRELAAMVAWRAGRADIAREHVVALTVIEPDREIHRRRLEAIDQRAGGG